MQMLSGALPSPKIARLPRPIRVLHGSAFRCVLGANVGDPMTPARSLVTGDQYRVLDATRHRNLHLIQASSGRLRVAKADHAPTESVAVHLDSVLQFMSLSGQAVEALLLAEPTIATDGAPFILPLGRFRARDTYQLIAISPGLAQSRFDALSHMCLDPSTRVSLASGALVPVGELIPGDALLTRDGGPRRLHAIARSTQPAQGPFAPVHVAAGFLNNAAELVVSAAQELLICRAEANRGFDPLTRRCCAADLINGSEIRAREGGYVTLCRLLFDAPQVIFAEGIPVCAQAALQSAAAETPPTAPAAKAGSLFEAIKGQPIAQHTPVDACS
ncbi:MAG: Hint domain-containing protein [Pseudomonadota bacterium]